MYKSRGWIWLCPISKISLYVHFTCKIDVNGSSWLNKYQYQTQILFDYILRYVM